MSQDVINKVTGKIAGTVLTVQQYAYEQKYTWDNHSTIEFYSSPALSDEYKSLIGIVGIEFFVPPSYDRNVVQLLALRKVREEKVRQFSEVLKELDETIAKLSSIGYDAPEVSTVEEEEALDSIRSRDDSF